MEKVKLVNDEKGVRLYIDEKKVYPSKSMKILTLEDFGVEKNENGEYYIKKQIVINKDEKLIIKPGSVIKIDPEIESANQSVSINGYEVFLRGSIIAYKGVIEAVGTEEKPIIFKSSNNEYCDAIELRYSNNSKFKWCKFDNMRGLLIEIDRWYIDSEIDDRLEGSFVGSGIYGAYSDNLIIENCTFENGLSYNHGEIHPDIYLYKCQDVKIENVDGVIDKE